MLPDRCGEGRIHGRRWACGLFLRKANARRCAQTFLQVYAASLEAGTIGVVITYVNGIFFDLNNYLSHTNTFVSNFLLKVRYVYLIVLFMVMSVLLFLRSKKMMAERRQHYIALIWTTWFSILSTFIVVCNLQGTLIHPYAHEFSAVANALYALRLCRVWICRCSMDEK